MKDSTVREIQELIQRADRDELTALKASLAADTRKGVIEALAQREKKLAAIERERMRLESLYRFDETHGDGGYVVGLDEVGRGAVAGPLAVGAVVLENDPFIEGLDDSKKIAPEKRKAIAEKIKLNAKCWTVNFVEPADIDRYGMSACLRRAFKGALDTVDGGLAGISTVLIDGNPLGIDKREQNVVKGDAQSASIAAASIIAKVERDALMVELSSTYPHYGFFHNKGYASADHRDAIRSEGLSPIHRASFCQSFLQESLF